MAGDAESERQGKIADLARIVSDAADEGGRERDDVESAQRLSRGVLAGALVRCGPPFLVGAAAGELDRSAGRTHARRRPQISNLLEMVDGNARSDDSTRKQSGADPRRRRAARPAILPAAAGRRFDFYRGVHRARSERVAFISERLSSPRF